MSGKVIYDLGEAVHHIFEERPAEEILSRVADEIRTRVPLDKRLRLIHDFSVHVRDGYGHVPHMAGFEDTK